MNIFYSSHVQWFENVANGSIWLLISGFAALLVWLGYDVIKGSALPDGYEPIADTKIVSHKATSGKDQKADDKAPASPFAPGKRKLTAKS